MIQYLLFAASKLLNISDITKRIGNFFRLPIQLSWGIAYPELAYIRIVPSTEPDGSMLLKVLVDPAANPAAYQTYVNRHILRNACFVAGKFLRPEVLEAAARVGVADRVSGVCFNTNRSNYGLCYRDGRIELSSRLVFYPAELRELVTMHELAHLTHHDHSAAFHALLDGYLGGRERELEKALRAFRSPLF